MSKQDDSSSGVMALGIVVALAILLIGRSFSEARHRIERLEKLHGLPQDTVFFTWFWDENKSRKELGIPRYDSYDSKLNEPTQAR